MPYVKQSWIDLDMTKPLSATRMNHLEDGVEAANGALDTLGTASVAYSPNSLARRDSLGRLSVATPTASDHAASRGFVESTTVGKGSVTFNVKDYGAVGDWSSGTAGTDDTAAINACFAAAGAAAAAVSSAARVLFPWTTGGGYKTLSAITVPPGVELDMRAAIIYCGTTDASAITIGNATAEFRRTHRVMVRRYTLSDWTNESSCGLLVRNQYYSTIHLVQASNFTVGATFIGDSGQGFSYNTVHLGEIRDNKIGVDLTNDTAGWCNENDFYGGRFTCSSGTHTSLDRIGVRSTSRAATKYYNNANVFHKPAFELKGSAIVGNSRGALIEYGSAHEFLSCRHESNSAELIEQLNDSHSNIMTTTYSDQGSGFPVFLNSGNSSSGGLRQRYDMMTEEAYRTVYKADALHRRACYYDGATLVNVPGLTVCTSSTSNTDARAASGIVIGADYVEIPNNRILGFYVSTKVMKRFAVIRESEAGFGGRVAIRCYDSAGSVITTAGTVRTTRVANTPVYATAFAGAFRTQADSDRAFDCQVSDATAYVFVGVLGGTAAARIRSLSVATRDPINPATWLAFPDNGENYGTAAPTAGTWAVGRKVINAVPTVGQPQGWICTVAGTPGTWVALPNL